jgi:ABC-type phosphate transport system substrate-binding protein
MTRATPILLPSLLVAAACVALFSAPARADGPNDILVIANKAVGVDSITLDELKAFFLKQRTSWKGGEKVNPIHAAAGSPLRQAFLQRVLGMSQSQETEHWQSQKIRQGLDGPAELANTLQAVFRVKGGVSYVFRSQYKDGAAKILLVIPG